MERLYNLNHSNDEHAAEVVSELIARPGTHRYARVALRVAHTFMAGKPYGDDFASVTDDVRILAARLAGHTWKTRHRVAVLEQFAEALRRE